jgi:hypothetical protein
VTCVVVGVEEGPAPPSDGVVSVVEDVVSVEERGVEDDVVEDV